MSIIGIEDAVMAAVHTLLVADSTLMALVTGIHDEVPQPLAYPYVQIGESTVTKDSTFTEDGRMVLCRLHVWSQYAGSKECSSIMARMGDLLDEIALSVSGAVVESCEVDQTQILRDQDGRTRHGIFDLRVKLASA